MRRRPVLSTCARGVGSSAPPRQPGHCSHPPRRPRGGHGPPRESARSRRVAVRQPRIRPADDEPGAARRPALARIRVVSARRGQGHHRRQTRAHGARREGRAGPGGFASSRGRETRVPHPEPEHHERGWADRRDGVPAGPTGPGGARRAAMGGVEALGRSGLGGSLRHHGCFPGHCVGAGARYV